ncbi:receptor-type tyrosine-protein phosphatase N2 isoform X1 [Phyllostomus hastatus]|uniref:receptor-type tyrosine-protein phosphatase N2 isoform X1 n=1 Tax=Phyllostomus hastatus TaxID=9423 RepID=UPI001E6839A0|nr:receptor-type tyrosine-protein phosphatase N2 isoform X1 [Phyllostomus hastatus]
MGPPLAPLLLLPLLLPPLLPAAPASLARPLPGLLGCLLEDGLCRPSETCVNDGVFGRCQKVPVTDTYRYEVSPGVLQHLTTTLQKLSRTGFTWQDDHTQHVLAQELAHLPRAHLRRPGAAHPARSLQPSAEDERRHRPEGSLALAKALERYLPYLEVLSQATAPDELPRMQQDGRPAQGEDPLADSALTFMDQTSALTYAPAFREGHPMGHPLQTLSRPQPDDLSPKGDRRVDKRNVLGQLMFYLAYRPPSPTKKGPLTPYDLMRMPWREPQKRLSPPEDPNDAPGPDDGALLQSLLEELRQHQVDVEALSPRDLDEAARVLAEAARDPWRGAGAPPTEPAYGPEAALFGVGDSGREGLRGNGEQGSEAGARGEVNPVSLRLGHALQDPGSQLPPGAPLPVGSKKSEDPEASLSSEEDAAGMENVKSQTYSKELWERPPHWEPRVVGVGESPHWAPEPLREDPRLRAGARGRTGDGLRLEVKSPGEDYGYIVTESDPLSPEKGEELIEDITRLLKVPTSVVTDTDVLGPAVTFRVSPNVQNVTTADVAKAAVDNKDNLERSSGLRILQAGVGSKSKLKLLPPRAEPEDSTKFVALTLLSVAAIAGVLLASGLIYCLRHSSHSRLKEKLAGLAGDPGPDATAAYQELCRQRMAVRTSDRPEAPHASRVNSVSSQLSDGPLPSPSARSSTSSWSEEPVPPNMDISTGHMVLAYMEDHLKNKNRLQKEWEALCAYQAEPSSSLVAQREENAPKNRCPAVLAYDHCRILLKAESSHSGSDYINASPVMDHDPRNPAYIATQGPLPATVADFWQMVWESGCVVIVMLTPLSENGVRQCYHYWPDEGSNLYHVYEVNLVSEHIWCEDFLVRSFYLKNLQTNETRTVTQFHFLSWYDQGVPSSTRSLLDFRRKVSKCYKGRSCPIIVHCSDGAGRSGTYILIDMVLNKMAKGAKEIDIAATLEHLRDQRPGMVQTKEQFEFALTAVAEEVNAILKALPQ